MTPLATPTNATLYLAVNLHKFNPDSTTELASDSATEAQNPKAGSASNWLWGKWYLCCHKQSIDISHI